MFEDRTYDALQAEAQAHGEELGIDTREGSIYMDAVSGINLKLAKYYTDLDNVFDLVMLDTSTGEYQDRRMEDHAMTRNSATQAEYLALFEGALPAIGERFFCDGIYFRLAQNGNQLIFRAEEAGSAANNILPGSAAVPQKTIDKLASATFGAVVRSGSDDESDESFRQRTREKLAGPAENGNRQHYKTWCEQIDGIGRARIIPLWDGPNTVKGVLIDANGLPAGPGLVAEVQEYVDPGATGLGEGIANMGSMFTAAAADAISIDIEYTAVLVEGSTVEAVKEQTQTAVAELLKSLALDTPEGNSIVVRIASVGAIILGLSSVIDYSDLMLNGTAGNILIQHTEVAVLGEVTVHVDFRIQL